MDASYAIPAPQAHGQSPFFYYTPDPKSDHRQHGHFSPHPNGHQSAQMQQFHQQMSGAPNTPAYSRPSSSCSQPQMAVPQATLKSSMMSTASPRQVFQKPAILVQDHSPRLHNLDTECADMYLLPATPPLSSSGSAISSPPSTCGVLPTPVNGVFFGLESLEGVKEGCEGEVQCEILAGEDWSRFGSPPMTPVFINPPSVTASQPSDLLSTNTCPSLSPSPSPIPQTATAEPKFDFCDPRNLTVGSTNSTLSVEFPPLPTLCAGDDEHRFMLGGETLTKSATEVNTFDFLSGPTLTHGLSSFDDFSDLDSEDDFANGLLNFAPTDNAVFFGNKRQRTDVLSLDSDNFVSEDEFEDFEDSEQLAVPGLPSPPESESFADASASKSKSASKKSKKSNATESEAMTRSSKHTASGNDTSQQTSSSQQSSNVGATQAGADGANNATDDFADSESTVPVPAPVNRRGRKQSLTEDPTKTFVCDLCSRRFRRQEHLKRHYRSLHTQEKPFECNECGKKFSRSDNLSQHARTHGTGAIALGVLEDGEMPNFGDQDSTSVLGAVLFNAAAAVSSSGSSDEANSGRDSISPSPSDNKSRKKRKRDE